MDTISTTGLFPEPVQGRIKRNIIDITKFNAGELNCWHCDVIIKLENKLRWEKGNQTVTGRVRCTSCKNSTCYKCVIEFDCLKTAGGDYEQTITTAKIITYDYDKCITRNMKCKECTKVNKRRIIPLDGLKNMEWFLCECGINQVIELESIGLELSTQINSRKHKKNNRKIGSNNIKIPSVQNSSRTFQSAHDEGRLQNIIHQAGGSEKVNQPTEAENDASTRSAYTVGDSSRASTARSMNRSATRRVTRSATPGAARSGSMPIFNVPATRPPGGITISNRFEPLRDQPTEKMDDGALQSPPQKKQRFNKKRNREESEIPTFTNPPIENLHIPKIRITNPQDLNESDKLKKLRECAKLNDVPYGFSKNRKELRFYPKTSKSRQKIIELLDSFEGKIIYIAPKPPADRENNVLIVIRNETYGETEQEQIEEMEKCIDIKPSKIKKLNSNGSLHLVIFPANRGNKTFTTTEIISRMKSTSERFFGAPKINAEPYRRNRNRIAQCKKCYKFDHTKHSCHGPQLTPRMQITIDGREVTVCRACRLESDHGANNAICPVFQNKIKENAQILQKKAEKEARKNERVYNSHIHPGISFADRVNEFPPLFGEDQPPKQPNVVVASNRLVITQEDAMKLAQCIYVYFNGSKNPV